MKKFSAFTLAEVLITLGIIGVVAAMTMPTLINQTNGAQYRAAFKKELSVISQAVTLNVALEDWDFADIDSTKTLAGMLQARTNVVRTAKYSDIAGTSADGKVSGGEGYSPIIDPSKLQIDTKKAEEEAGKTHVDATATAPAAGDTVLMFNDGSMFIFKEPGAACTASAPCTGWFDVNGMKGPNKQTVCDNGDADTCSVKIPTDIFSVKFYDRTILPNSGEGRAVLYDNGNTASQK